MHSEGPSAKRTAGCSTPFSFVFHSFFVTFLPLFHLFFRTPEFQKTAHESLPVLHFHP
jgi:hypothetical protein